MGEYFSEKEIGYAQDMKDELYYKIMDKIVAVVEASIEDYAAYWSVSNDNSLEEPPLGDVIEDLCDQLFEDLQLKLMKVIK